MNSTRLISTLLLIVLSVFNAVAQGNQQVEMADVLRRDGKIYTVVAGLVVILTVMIVFLIRVEIKLSKIEREKQA